MVKANTRATTVHSERHSAVPVSSGTDGLTTEILGTYGRTDE
jgi:hypothetical protein